VQRRHSGSRRFSGQIPRRPPKFDFERFLFKTKWYAFHLAFTIVALAWVGTHAYEDLRSLLNSVVSAHPPVAQVCVAQPPSELPPLSGSLEHR